MNRALCLRAALRLSPRLSIVRRHVLMSRFWTRGSSTFSRSFLTLLRSSNIGHRHRRHLTFSTVIHTLQTSTSNRNIVTVITMKICSYLTALILLPLGGVVNASATSSALDAFKTLDYRYFVAGGTCAAISHGITTPIDVVKTKIQANPKKYNKGMITTAATILKEEGPDALLGGLGPTVVGYGIEGTYRKFVRSFARSRSKVFLKHCMLSLQTTTHTRTHAHTSL
jgi:hypothetical protein